MQVYFGTVNRSAPVRQGGELVRLDWDTKKVVASVPIFPENPSLDHDPNPRGNTRGCRGIAVVDGNVLAASYHTVRVFDPDLRPLRDLSHGLMVGLHEIDVVGNRVWVTSTVIDAALEYDLTTGALLTSYWPREVPSLQEELDVTPIQMDKSADQRAAHLVVPPEKKRPHLHLNAVAHWEGRTIALLNRRGVIVDLASSEILVRSPSLRGAHNLVVTADGRVMANESFGHRIRTYDLRTGAQVHELDLTRFPFVRRLQRRAVLKNKARRVLSTARLARPPVSKPLFVRGLDLVDGLLFVGMSPASIICIDTRTDELVDAYQHSSDVRVCIHGLCVDAASHT